MLIFGKDTFLVLITRMISTIPISSQTLIFETSHFTTQMTASYSLASMIESQLFMYLSSKNY